MNGAFEHGRRPPRLNLHHGFVRQIRACQLERAEDSPLPVAAPASPLTPGCPVMLKVIKNYNSNDNNKSNDLSPDLIIRTIRDRMITTGQLINVAHLLVDKSCEDTAYTEVGAKLCANIVKEVKYSNPSSKTRFVAALVDSCRNRLDVAEDTRNRSIEKWVTLVKFLIACHRSKETVLSVAVQDMLLEVLMNLTQPPCCLNRTEVDALYSALVGCGRDLKAAAPEHWSAVACRLADSFINIPPDGVVNSRLLRCIEVIASEWSLL